MIEQLSARGARRLFWRGCLLVGAALWWLMSGGSSAHAEDGAPLDDTLTEASPADHLSVIGTATADLESVVRTASATVRVARPAAQPAADTDAPRVVEQVVEHVLEPAATSALTTVETQVDVTLKTMGAAVTSSGQTTTKVTQSAVKRPEIQRGHWREAARTGVETQDPRPVERAAAPDRPDELLATAGPSSVVSVSVADALDVDVDVDAEGASASEDRQQRDPAAGALQPEGSPAGTERPAPHGGPAALVTRAALLPADAVLPTSALSRTLGLPAERPAMPEHTPD